MAGFLLQSSRYCTGLAVSANEYPGLLRVLCGLGQQARHVSSVPATASDTTSDSQPSTSYGSAERLPSASLRSLAVRGQEVLQESPGVGSSEPVRFVSRAQSLRPRPPPRRIPITFPDFTLQMMKLTKEELAQVKETGWLREAAFKTTPNMTKLEIKAILEDIYGMRVEAVRTINYLGRRYDQLTQKGKRHTYRADDWKKAYVVFAPPPELQEKFEAAQRAALEAARQRDGPALVQELRTAKLGRRAPPLFPASGNASQEQEQEQ